ncbi:hypothetical protein BU24DRAFT_212600 [Aaosphaeria arxii CBS 175.79]|uniref:Uncharacterized protein n=1 Tax=Aaosphaeria arxii CBS 175.79 TaxID=1450172 RepID=A0A6A5XN59_9PLEO|nr:uncharacterized protein BU24DRAFT_212600 [Aaosphaeria arxii CBS 175.79]KAF2014287.1 hypothetical protein BU24DRAFT_212600 [Aaosphaeria arxii CBS 175.79]
MGTRFLPDRTNSISERATNARSRNEHQTTPSQRPPTGKYVLSLDCEELLKLSTNRPGIYVAKTVDELMQHLQLEALIAVPILHEIKIKMFHTCGPVELQEGSCLRALTGIGAWLVSRYEEFGKPARCEPEVDVDTRDWADPDAILQVFIDQAGNGVD